MSVHEQEPLRGTATPPAGRPNTTWARDRTCVHLGCDTRLSIYNRSSRCWVHEIPKAYVVRGRRRRRAVA